MITPCGMASSASPSAVDRRRRGHDPRAQPFELERLVVGPSVARIAGAGRARTTSAGGHRERHGEDDDRDVHGQADSAPAPCTDGVRSTDCSIASATGSGAAARMPVSR